MLCKKNVIIDIVKMIFSPKIIAIVVDKTNEKTFVSDKNIHCRRHKILRYFEFFAILSMLLALFLFL